MLRKFWGNDIRSQIQHFNRDLNMNQTHTILKSRQCRLIQMLCHLLFQCFRAGQYPSGNI